MRGRFPASGPEFRSSARHEGSLRAERDALRRRCAELEELYRALAEHSNDLVGTLDAQGRVLHTSPNLRRVLGIDPDAVRGRSFLELVHPHDRAAVGQAIERGRGSGEAQYALFRRQHADGSWRWFESWGRRYRGADGEPRAVAVSRDVTERRHLELLQERQTTLLQEIARGLGRDPALEALAELVEASAPGQRCALLLGGPGETLRVAAAPSLPELRSRAIPANGCGLASFAPEAAPPDLRWCWCEPILLPGGRRAGLVALLGPERRPPTSFDRRLLGTAVHLASLVLARDEAERERARLDEQLLQKQKLESLGLLAGGIAHDFNNLLTGILGNAEVAAETLAPDHAARAMLRDVVDAATQAGLLTGQLLAYAGRAPTRMQLTDLSQRVRETARLLASALPPGVQLELELDETLPAIRADAAQIQQVVMNLLLNAIEAVGAGEGAVRLRTAAESLAAEDTADLETGPGWRPGLHVLFEVRDDGRGMDDATRARIFDPFFTTKFTGRGLGLAGVLGSVRRHGGALRVESKPGVGTTFQVYWPAEGGAAQPEPVARAALPAVERWRILVVDDEATARRAAARILEQAGHQVATARDGSGALRCLRAAGGFDLVLLDLTMPGMGGEETLAALRAVHPEVRALLVSGHPSAGVAQRGAARWAGFVSKPFTACTLLAAVQTALGATAPATRSRTSP